MASIGKGSACAEGGLGSEAKGSGGVSRRGFLRGIGGAGAAATAVGIGLGSTAIAPDTAQADVIGPVGPRRRRWQAFAVRRNAARAYLLDPHPGPQPCNGDEGRYPDKRAAFTKCLPHNELGEVDLNAYQAFLEALHSADPADFERIPLAPGATRKLANPQAAYAFDLTGLDSHATRMPAAPAFAGAPQAAEMGEVYWQAITRDVPFADYHSNALIQAAVADLNRFSETVGPTEGGAVTPGTLFRGETPGDLNGPYISQFLWLPVPYGLAAFEQKYRFPVAGVDFGTSSADWLALLNGRIPAKTFAFEAEPQYIYNNRGLGEFVHQDVTFQAYFNAALIMAGLGPDALDPNNPYLRSLTQGAFATLGVAEIVDLVTRAANVSLKGAWWQKWLVHRRLRPEVFAGRVENQRNGVKDYEIHPDLVRSDAVSRLAASQGNALLPLAYPEGSPTHPSYPAGHATIAGACATVLKAFFNEDYVIPAPVQASADGSALESLTGIDLTLGGEINKLANNVALGRDAAGVHYRSDGVDGLVVGEQQAIGILRDFSRTYNEEFAGFTLTRLDGRRILIVEGEVFEI